MRLYSWNTISKIWGGYRLDGYTSNRLTGWRKIPQDVNGSDNHLCTSASVEGGSIWQSSFQEHGGVSEALCHQGFFVLFCCLLLWCASTPLAPCHVVLCPSLNCFGAQMSKNFLSRCSAHQSVKGETTALCYIFYKTKYTCCLDFRNVCRAGSISLLEFLTL